MEAQVIVERVATADRGESLAEPGNRGSNQSGMRAHNERLVLTLVRRHGALAKAEIARTTGLSAQTVSVIMRQLEADGLLVKGDPIRGKVGQPSVPMRLAADGAYFLGIKIGRRNEELVLIDFLGQVQGRVQRTHAYPRPDDTVRFAIEALRELTDPLSAAQKARIAGLGIAIPFEMWNWARLIGVDPADMASWQDRDIKGELAAQVPYPVYMQNDASCACSAELVFGAQDTPRDFLYFYVGYFIGGGLVLNGTLYSGRSGNAGALGSMPVPGKGAPLQLIDVASLSGLEKLLGVAGPADPRALERPREMVGRSGLPRSLARRRSQRNRPCHRGVGLADRLRIRDDRRLDSGFPAPAARRRGGHGAGTDQPRGNHPAGGACRHGRPLGPLARRSLSAAVGTLPRRRSRLPETGLRHASTAPQGTAR